VGIVDCFTGNNAPSADDPGGASNRLLHVKQSPFLEALRGAVAGLPTAVSETALLLMDEHWQLVKRWNERVNLTAVTDDTDAAYNHYRDSLEGLRILPPGPIVDIGSGAGFPGVPLAIVDHDRAVTLVEPRRKRASFLEAAVARLGLTNLKVVNASSSDLPETPFAAAVTRATFSAAEELNECLAWLVPGGPLIAYRSEPTGNNGTQLHPYEVRGRPRVLEVWTRPG
jgi:16S rRNA (guanine527-N7)-methyltransferase